MSSNTQRTIVLLAAIFMTANFASAEKPAEKPAETPAKKIARADLGRSVKLTVLVDKVMQPQAGWVSEEWMVREAAEAGFNVFSPRAGYDRHDEVRRVAAWCKKYGIYHMPWMRGTLTAPEGSKADGKRVVWAGGNQQALWSPNSDEFWQWTNHHILEYAKISRENPHLMGVFLDYENYAPRKEGNLYELSYDDTIMGKFAKSKGIELPRLDFDKRKNWLESQKLHEEFSQFQINHWRERCRALREAVDRLAPDFQFCIYPAPGSTFMVEAALPDWSTKKAPIILADASVYGRPGRFLSQKDSLAGNRERLLKRMEVPRKAGVPFMYSGGIDPLVRGADPEFSGKNAVMISDVTDGYWIFYEGPTYTKPDHANYWKWFTWANQAIAKGNFDVQHEPRKTPTDWGQLEIFKQAADATNLKTAEASGRETKYATVQLRGDNLLLLSCRAGQAVAVKLANRPVGKNDCVLAWEVCRAGGDKIASGTIPHASQGMVAFTPDKDGVYLLGASSGSCSWSVQSSNVAVGMYAREWLKLIRAAKRLYFQVPATVDKFTITLKGAGAETVRANIFDPDGKQVATGQTTLDKNIVKIDVSTGPRDTKSCGSVWSLQTTRADQGTLEDYSIRLDAKLPPTLSLTEEQVFGIKK